MEIILSMPTCVAYNTIAVPLALELVFSNPKTGFSKAPRRPYPHIRPPDICSECNAPHSHAGNECPARFARILGRRCLAGLEMGKRMQRRGLVTAFPCYSPRWRR